MAMASGFPSLNKKDFKRKEKLGKGGFALVFKAEWISKGNKLVAIKDIDKKEHNLRELEVLAFGKHKNIVQYYGFFESVTDYCIVFELAEFGDLDKFIKDQPVREDIALKIAMDVTCGICFLHKYMKKTVIHRDLKSHNVLLFEDKERMYLAKICDFGLAKQFHQTAKMTFCGTYIFMAPEMSRKEEVSLASDIWSLGCILLHMATGRLPFHDIPSEADVIRALDSNKHPTIPVNYDGMFKGIIQRCFQAHPKERGSSLEVMEQLTQCLERENRKLVMEKEKVMNENEKLVMEKEKVMKENEKLVMENEKVMMEKEKVMMEKWKVMKENDKVIMENRKLVMEKEKAMKEKETVTKQLEMKILQTEQLEQGNKRLQSKLTEQAKVFKELKDLEETNKEMLTERQKVLDQLKKDIHQQQDLEEKTKEILTERQKVLDQLEVDIHQQQGESQAWPGTAARDEVQIAVALATLADFQSTP